MDNIDETRDREPDECPVCGLTPDHEGKGHDRMCPFVGMTLDEIEEA